MVVPPPRVPPPLVDTGVPLAPDVTSKSDPGLAYGSDAGFTGPVPPPDRAYNAATIGADMLVPPTTIQLAPPLDPSES